MGGTFLSEETRAACILMICLNLLNDVDALVVLSLVIYC